jgi:GNAT superfamily N-acetyltransferase
MSEPTIQISTATSADMDWLSKVDVHVGQPWVRRCVELDEYLIARAGGEAAGFLRHSMFWGAVPFMDLIYVEPSWRRRGVGSSLLQVWQQAMQDRGATVLMTSSMSDEVDPQAWHHRNGFERSGALTFGSYQSTPEVFFVKSL